MHIISLTGLLALPLVLATHLRVSIPSTPLLQHPSTLPPSTHATLTTLSHHYSAPLTTTNSFDFRNVTCGSYLLDIHCHTHVFAPLRVDVTESSGKKVVDGVDEKEVQVWDTFRGNEWGNKGEVKEVKEVEDRVGVWGFEVTCVGKKEYLIERSGFSPMSILKNPMILIAGVSMILVFGMPYIMDNMDEETKAEFAESQKRSPLAAGGGAPKSLQNFDAAAWLAGSSTPKRTETPVEKGVTR
ncbi:hypothetical protein WAI453_010519 [Rhynchosporium graminicola]|uniref:ER membrane protein complex subunit 7 beta-sandwich domain-containing protein n=1 Tax=Rhynchosporium graminicola TaxID=2792576 RepID=A0A1E1JTA7_9HELO|nr:uncharacterized protein RCO7_04584 [Rhynchosporium commune]